MTRPVKRALTAPDRRGAAVTKQTTSALRRPKLLMREALRPAPRQRRSLEGRARLKAAALELFRERGYAGTSIDDIAARARLAVGGFYLQFRSKRQLLVVLMDDFVGALSEIDLRLDASSDPRAALRDLLSRAFSSDLQYLGAYRAWQEAILTDVDLASKQRGIHAWTTARVLRTFTFLQTLPGARAGVDLQALARVMDTFFWSLLGEALRLPVIELHRWLDSATHLVFHALFADEPRGRMS
jgi:AcrR family transcriptional regulator